MAPFNTNFAFSRGKLTVTLDGGAGSSGKGKLGSFLCEHATNWQFACNTFTPQAGHWVKLDGGRELFYQTLNSCAYLADRYEKIYIGPGGAIDLEKFNREVEENRIPRHKIGISALTSVLQSIDTDFEQGLCDFDGVAKPDSDGGYLAKTGSTAHGCGTNRARRVLRHPAARYARDVPELNDLLCDVPSEIMARLDRGQSGLFEIAQGFQLSYLLPDFFPYTTSRNCTIAAGFDDLMVPPCYAGQLVLNFRTYPIRINSNKYLDQRTRKHLTGDQVTSRVGTDVDKATVESLNRAGIELVIGDSGPGYEDQHETSWEELTKQSGSAIPLRETTSVTRLPRRVFTFSRANVQHALRHNQINGDVHLAINFANYVDSKLAGVQGVGMGTIPIGSPLRQWLQDNLKQHLSRLKFVGTGPKTDDMIQLT